MAEYTKEQMIKELGITEEDVRKFQSCYKDDSVVSDELTFKNPFTGEVKTVTITEEQAKTMNAELDDTEEYEDWIDNQDFGVHGDKIKPILKKLLGVTQTVGKTILRIGKILVDFFMKFLKLILKEFPNAVFGILAGFVLGLLISWIPLVGWILGGLAIPLCASVGGVLGFAVDMKNKINNPELVDKIENGFKSFIANFGTSNKV